MTTVDWIAVDWGTSSLRAFAMSGTDVVARTQSDQGMGQLQPEDFEGALLSLISPWLSENKCTDVIACGMVGALQGWIEAPYSEVPTKPLADDFVRPLVTDPRISVAIIPGLKQPNPADVMRGEETQIAGFLAALPNFDGVLCLPGTHTKWAQISAGEVVSFRTFMTGELFALLATSSVLKHSVTPGLDEAAFDHALSDAMSRPEALASRLFGIRAGTLLDGLDPTAAHSMISGMLIGMELAASRPYWLGQSVAIIGASELAQLYSRALTQQGATPIIADANAATTAGLVAAYDLLKGKTL